MYCEWAEFNISYYSIFISIIAGYAGIGPEWRPPTTHVRWPDAVAGRPAEKGCPRQRPGRALVGKTKAASDQFMPIVWANVSLVSMDCSGAAIFSVVSSVPATASSR